MSGNVVGWLPSSVLRHATRLFIVMFGLKGTVGESSKQTSVAARTEPSGSTMLETGSQKGAGRSTNTVQAADDRNGGSRALMRALS